jgi:hypothetical protein
VIERHLRKLSGGPTVAVMEFGYMDIMIATTGDGRR